MDGLAYIRDG